jgi:hypothetical protein
MELSVKIKETENGDVVLTRNDRPLICPLATRLLTPGNMAGSLTMNQAVCGSHCALFKIFQDRETGCYDVYLCNNQYFHKIEKISESPKTIIGRPYDL